MLGMRAAAVVFLLLTACPADPPPGPARTGSNPPGSTAPPAARGGTDFASAIRVEPRRDAAAVVIDVRLEPGFHVYAEGEAVGRPLRAKIDEGRGWEATGPAQYPEGEKKQTSLGPSVIVERKAEVRLPVRPLMDEPGPVHGELHYQVCTDEACDRPRVHRFSVD